MLSNQLAAGPLGSSSQLSGCYLRNSRKILESIAREFLYPEAALGCAVDAAHTKGSQESKLLVVKFVAT